MVTVRQCRVADYIDSIGEMLASNWAETGFDFPFAPDTEFYKRLDAANMLLVVGAFDGDKPVGYSTAMVAPHPFNPSVICCSSDALFVHPDYRNGLAGYRLMRETERLAKELGATRMLWHARGQTKLVETLQKRGYEMADVVLMGRL